MQLKPFHRSAHCLAGSLFISLLASSATAAFTNLAVTADTFILSSGPDNNAGGHTHVASGRDNIGGIRRGLLQFDLSNIPAGATITSALLNVSVILTPPGAANSTFDISTISAAWGEGLKSGANGSFANNGESTWNSRMHGIAAWATAGGDFSPAPLAATAITGNALYSWSGTGLIATVQAWINAPASNNGLLLKSQSEGVSKTARQFGSREGGTPASLEIGFVPPPPPAFTTITLSTNNNTLTLVWANSQNRRYDILYTHTLVPTQLWSIAAANIPAAPAGTNVWTDPPVLAGPLLASTTNRFYALRELPASPPGLPITLPIIASNLVAPTAITHAHDGSGRLFIAEQLGQIRILDSTHTLLPTPFLDISAAMTNLAPNFGPTPGINPVYDERGLLGLAFHTNYAANGRFFIFYNAPKTGPGIHCESILSEFKVSATNANLADPASEQILLRFDKPEFNHNGGDITFGPDGLLYIPVGDGGGAGDQHPPYGNAQNVSNLLGKILRINVESTPPYTIPPDNPLIGVTGARPEIFAWGLRNPWKVAFDGTNLWVADVGQDRWEEIDLVRNGGNYGWRIIEGQHAFDLNTANQVGTNVPALDFPIHEYPHGPLGISIIGGFVYRGTNYPALQGRYVFGDFSTAFFTPDGALYYLEESRSNIWERFAFTLPTTNRLNRFVKTFGLGPDGELYLGSTLNLGPSGTSGDIRQLRPPP